ncbi:MAG: class I SAM-dependent methyltransferase [Desulforhopalus sp.]|nr:class I SAM-dependent methyltransferase [Desulforhopalus sp.]
MVTIYQNYQDEPADVFLPLPEELACDFYALEMENFSEDCDFFEQVIPKSGVILEMGCGTGRVARHLAHKNRPVTGIDISLPMLRLAVQHRHPHCSFLCMDMLAPAFRKFFDTILIPYNTLNLFTNPANIRRCLLGCRANLQRKGRLVIQLYIPTTDFRENHRTTFQFQMFNRPGGGRLIKEILTRYQPESQTVQLEDRFRVRPMQQGIANEDYQVFSSIAGFSLGEWMAFFAAAGFTAEHIYGNYSCGSYDPTGSSCCLLVLKRQYI